MTASGSDLFIGEPLFVYETPDGGETWTFWGGLTQKCTALAVSGKTIVAGTDWNGVYMRDGINGTWTACGPVSRNVAALCVSGSAIYAALNDGIMLYGGRPGTWTDITTSMPINNVVVMAASGDRLFAGMSSNGIRRYQLRTRSWTQVNTGVTQLNIRSLFAHGSAMYAGANGVVYRSTTGGDEWIGATAGLPRTPIYALCASGKSLFAATDSGVFVSTNDGQQWTGVSTGLENLSVRALVVAGNSLYAASQDKSVWKRPLSEMIALTPPIAPTVVAPQDNDVGIASSPTLQWNAVSGALSYRVQLARDTGSVLFISDSTIDAATTSMTVSGLDLATHYYWRIRTTDAGGTGMWSDWKKFKTSPPLPPPPTLRSPADSATRISTDTLLIWNGIPEAERYEVQISSSSAFESYYTITKNVGRDTTRVAVANLWNRQNYWWRVRGVNEGGPGAWSSTWTFTTITPYPDQPLLLAPSSDAANVSTDPEFSWTAAGRADSYELQVSVNSRFVPTVAAVRGLTTTSCRINGLTNAAYYWRVVAVNRIGTTISPVQKFTTNALPLQGQWTQANTGLGDLRVTALAASGNVLLAATWGGKYLYRSVDSGATWSAVNGVQSSFPQQGMLATLDDIVVVSTGSGTAMSRNSGETWNAMYMDGAFPTCDFVASIGKTIFAGSKSSSSLIKTSDLGKTRDLVPLNSQSTSVRTVGARNGMLLVGTNLGLDRSRDLGATWMSTSNPEGWSFANAFDLTSSPYFWSTYDRALVSTDSGATWKSAGLTNSAPSAFCRMGSSIFAGTSGGGIYLSTTDGATWIDVGTTPFGGAVNGLAVIGSTLFAGTNGGGVWKRRLSEMTTLSPPPAPVLTAPQPGELVSTSNPKLAWHGVPGALGYHLQIAVDSSFTLLVLDLTGLVQPAYVPDRLTIKTEYYWRVSASSAGGTSAWSDTRRFVVSAEALMGPKLVSPLSGDTGMVTQPLLSWQPTTIAAQFHLHLSTDSLFSRDVSVYTNIYTTTYQIYGLAYYKRYYWRVYAINALGDSAAQPSWSFTTRRAFAVPPTLLTPKNGEAGVAATTVFTWNSSSAAASYDLQISTDSLFSTLMIDQRDMKYPWVTIGGITRGTRCFWRVGAVDSGGVAWWSAAWSFTTAIALPEKTILCSPTAGARIGADSIRFTWRAAGPSIGTYTIEVIADSTLTRDTKDTSIVLKIAAAKTEKTVTWRVRASNASGAGPFSDVWSLIRLTTSVPRVAALPSEYSVGNYPNPFNPSTAIAFSLPLRSFVSLKIFDAMGREVATIASEEFPAGTHLRSWNASGMPSGVYFYRLHAGTFTETKRLVLLR